MPKKKEIASAGWQVNLTSQCSRSPSCGLGEFVRSNLTSLTLYGATPSTEARKGTQSQTDFERMAIPTWINSLHPFPVLNTSLTFTASHAENVQVAFTCCHSVEPWCKTTDSCWMRKKKKKRLLSLCLFHAQDQFGSVFSESLDCQPAV